MLIHYKPLDGHVGDVVPFYWEGVYHAFYLKRREGIGTSYGHAASRDLVHWETLPDAIDVGKPGEPDHGNCFTGSIIQRDGVFHLFYTGHTPDNPPYPTETICHATSRDLIHWQKDASNPILQADERWYERDDWRDPFVFWNCEEQRYWMLLTARLRGAAVPRSGCVALATSPDLRHWEVHPPLWVPHIAFALECCDVFRAVGRHFLIFSNVETRYRTFRDWKDVPFYHPPTDALDTPRFYAAKAFHVGDRHLLAGWVSSNKGERDEGAWEWGGAMGMVRELVPEEDGHLWIRVPEEVRSVFKRLVYTSIGEKAYPSAVQPVLGEWQRKGSLLIGIPGSEFALATLPKMPADFRLYVEVSLQAGTKGGFLLRLQPRIDAGYQVVLDEPRQRLLVRRWEAWGEHPSAIERPFEIKADSPVRVEAYVMGSILEIFLDDKVALTTRIYDYKHGDLGIFVYNSPVSISRMEVTTL